jgi:WhiB family redox-sensing transcriptional regulator
MSLRRAKEICSTCQVRLECLEAGMDEDYGIWGGLSPKRRAKLRKATA